MRNYTIIDKFIDNDGNNAVVSVIAYKAEHEIYVSNNTIISFSLKEAEVINILCEAFPDIDSYNWDFALDSYDESEEDWYF